MLRNEEEQSEATTASPLVNTTEFGVAALNCSQEESEQEVNWNDAIVFKYLAFGALALGLFFSMLFHCFVHENNEPCDEGKPICTPPKSQIG